jgi:two-component system nitrate/nitrite response regulator NarL
MLIGGAAHDAAARHEPADPATPDPIRARRPGAVVVDEWDLALVGIADAVEAAGYTVVARAGSAHEALYEMRERSPRLAVWGKVADLTTSQAVRRTKQLPAPPAVAVLLPILVADEVYQLLSLGVEALMLRSTAHAPLKSAIERVSAGERVVAPSLVPLLTGARSMTEAVKAHQPLSRREREVLGLLAEGHSNREIAENLYVSLDTVKTHLRRLYDKLGVSSRHEAVGRALSLEILG